MTEQYNKIITTINSITQDYTLLPRQNQCIVIDSSNNRIGINNFNPEHSIDISYGKIRTHDIEIIGDASINNLNYINLLNENFIYKDIDKNILHIKSNSNTINFDTEVEFKILPLFPSTYTPKIDEFRKTYDISLDRLNNNFDTTLVNGDRVDNTIHQTGINKRIYVNINDTLFFHVEQDSDYYPVYLKKHTITGTLNLIDTPTPSLQGVSNEIITWTPKIAGTYFYTCDTIGLNWKNIGPVASTMRPSSYEIINSILKEALQTTLNFTLTEFKKFNIQNITTSHYIESNGNYYQPKDNSYNNMYGEIIVQSGAVEVSYNFIPNDVSFGGGYIWNTTIGRNSSGTILTSDAFFRNIFIENDLSCSNIDISENIVIEQDITIKNDGYIHNNFEVSNNLLVHNDISCLKNLFINNDISCRNIDISENIFIQENINVYGKMDISGKIITDSDISCINIEISNNALIKNELTVNDDVIIHGNLRVEGTNMYIYGDGSQLTNVGKDALEIWNDASFNNIDVSENIFINGYLDVINDGSFNRNVYINNDLIVNQKLQVDRSVLFNSSLDVNSFEVNTTSIFKGDTSFNTNVEISNNLLVKHNFTVNNQADISGLKIFNKLDASYIEVSNNLLIKHDLNVNNQVDVSGLKVFNRLDVDGDVSLNKDLYIDNDVLIKNDLSVNNIIKVNEINLLNRLDVHGDVSLNNNIEVSNNLLIKHDLSVNNYIDVSGLKVINNINAYSIEIINDGIVKHDLSVNNYLHANNSIILNNLDVSYIEVSNNLLIYNDLSVNNKVDVSGLKIFNRLDVDGDISFNNNLQIVNDVLIEHDLSVNNQVDVSGLKIFNRLDVINDVSFNSNLQIVNDALIEHDLSVNNQLDVSGLKVFNRLDVDSDVSFNNNLEIINDVLIKNDLSVNNVLNSNSIIVSNDLSVNGFLKGDGSLLTNVGKDTLTRFNDGSFNNVDISGIFTILNSGEFNVNTSSSFRNLLNMNNNNILNINNLYSNKIIVNNDSSFNRNLNIDGNLTVNKKLIVNGETIITSFSPSDLTVLNNLTTPDITINNNLYSNQNNYFYKRIDASFIEISNNLLSKDCTIKNQLDVSYLEVSNNLLVKKKSVFENDVSFNNSIDISNNLNISGKINNINLISFKLKGDSSETYIPIFSNTSYKSIFNYFTNSANHFGCYVNGVTYDDIYNNSGLKIKESGIYNISLNINWIIGNGSTIYETSFYISLVTFNSLEGNDDLYDKNKVSDIYERLAVNKLGPFGSNNIFYFSDIKSSDFTQNINENVFLKKDTIVTPYIKLNNITLPDDSDLNIGINYSKSSWGVTQIN